MRRLTVASVAYPFAPVGPDSVGGAEQILSALDHALVAAGHRSIVVAVEGSTVAGELVSLARPIGVLDDTMIVRQRARAHVALAELLRRETVDVVHMHGIDFHHYLPTAGAPVLVTLHLPIAWYPAHALKPDRPRTWLHGVSASQAASAPSTASLLPPITNGVPIDVLSTARLTRRSFSLMLARICPEKGQHLALAAAHAANETLLLGGEVYPYPAHQAYFDNQVRPLLDQRRHFLGPVGFARKRRLIAAARCVLIPSLAPETSSLVAMEAASCGTPVIAFRTGALTEVVEHGRTGYLVDDAAGMEAALQRVGEIDHQLCRDAARKRFSLDRMANAYIRRYRLLTGSPATRAA